MVLQLKKITCAFCKCELVYSEGHLNRLIRHIKFEHGIIFNVKYIMASCFLIESEMDAVTDIVFKKNNLEVTDDVVAEVTLHNNVVREKQKVIDINYNTGATYRRVLDRTNEVIIEEKIGSGFKVEKKAGDDHVKRTRSHQEYDESRHKKSRGSSTNRKPEDSARIAINNGGGKPKLIKSYESRYEVPMPNPPNNGVKISPKPSKFNCDECDLSYTRKFSLIKHQKEKHVKTAETTIAGNTNTKKAVIESLLFDDDSSIQEPTKPVCEYCDKTFKLQSHLKLHKKRFHSKKTEVVGNEGIFVAVEENENATKLEAQLIHADPFLTDIREKLMIDMCEDSSEINPEDVDADQDEIAHEMVTVTENVGGHENFFTAVEEALHSDFVIA